jgi:poly(A) polymerase
MSQKVDLKIAQVLAPQEWMKDSRTRAVMDALGNRALFVGGCVRNAVLAEVIGDIDLATPLTPQEVTQKLEAAGIKVVPTGIDHGTVTGVVEGKPFEITTLRRDVETDGRRAVVAYTEDWREDAQRRDFTMNTLLADIEGNVYDPLGTGLADLQARRVVFVGDPAARIAEDTLRILRFFRFHAFYGRGAPDPAALAACKNAADKISSLSKERITQEFFKILSAQNPQEILALMFEHAVLVEFETPLYDPALMQRFCDLQRHFSLPSLPARLRVLAGLDSQGSQAFERFLIIPKAFKTEMDGVRSVLALPELTNDHAVKVAVYKFGRAAAAQALMIELAQNCVAEDFAPKALEIIQKWEIPVFPVSGEDLIREGFKPGPDLGAELTRREEAWIAGGF